MDTFGKLVRKYRDKSGESLKQVARGLKVSEVFVRHMEYSRVVPISERVAKGLSRHYRIPLSKVMRAVASRNRVGRAYYRAYRKKRAS